MRVGRGEKEALIALSLVSGLGPARIRALIREFGSAEAVFRTGAAQLERIRGISSRIAHDIVSMEPGHAARQQLDRACRCDARCLHPNVPGYPALLRHIFDPPPVLWARGREDVVFERTLAIVGTRRPSEQGRRFAYDLAHTLSKRGWTITSGLAYGIDACAHKGALDAGGFTVAVLGCGVDVVYPAAHRRLYNRIMSQGVLLSEFPMGGKPDGTNFPRRNRVMSGMSLGIVLVEAYETGGGSITARFALDQNREVFAVPGAPGVPTSIGCNRLIQAGEAKLVLSADDVEEEFGIATALAQVSLTSVAGGAGETSDDPVLNSLSGEPQHIDVLCTKTGLSASDLQARLLMLEISGAVIQLPGNRFYLRD